MPDPSATLDPPSHPATDLQPLRVMEVGTAFMAAKTLLSAVELDLFTTLSASPLTSEELAERLGLHPRAVPDFPDTLVSLGLLDRDGEGPAARYANTAETATFLDRSNPRFLGALLEMCNDRLYAAWDGLTDSLRTGQPQSRLATGDDLFGAQLDDPAGADAFAQAMAGLSLPGIEALVATYDFSQHTTLCDVGGSTGQLCIAAAKQYPHLSCTTFDLPQVAPIAQRTVQQAGLDATIHVTSGDFFNDPLPHADVITMGRVLHDWGLEQKLFLLRAAYDALPVDGVLIAVENLIDDARRENTLGLLTSLNMLIELGEAFDFTGADFNRWCLQVGFRRTEIIHLAGPTFAAVAYK